MKWEWPERPSPPPFNWRSLREWPADGYYLRPRNEQRPRRSGGAARDERTRRPLTRTD